MRKVTPADIQEAADYEIGRAALRTRILAIKAARRVAIGDHLTVLFENHDTVRYQIQEMLRIERITDRAAIRHEIDTYNELVAGPDELRATLLIEYEDAAERDRWLRALLGLERHLHLVVPGVGECRARFDDRQISSDRISSVHYVTFALGPRLATAIREGAGVVVHVDHPRLEAQAELSVTQLAAVREDLAP
jgi:hypothetical protein